MNVVWQRNLATATLENYNNDSNKKGKSYITKHTYI